jgi:hypothetical protein
MPLLITNMEDGRSFETSLQDKTQMASALSSTAGVLKEEKGLILYTQQDTRVWERTTARFPSCACTSTSIASSPGGSERGPGSEVASPCSVGPSPTCPPRGRAEACKELPSFVDNRFLPQKGLLRQLLSSMSLPAIAAPTYRPRVPQMRVQYDNGSLCGFHTC